MRYSGLPQEQGRFGGLAFRTDPAGRHWINTANEGEGSSVWWPSKDQWRDEPEGMDLRVAVPNGLMDVSNGKFLGKTDVGNGYTRWHWRVHYPIDSYNVSLDIGEYVQFRNRRDNRNLLLIARLRGAASGGDAFPVLTGGTPACSTALTFTLDLEGHSRAASHRTMRTGTGHRLRAPSATLPSKSWRTPLAPRAPTTRRSAPAASTVASKPCKGAPAVTVVRTRQPARVRVASARARSFFARAVRSALMRLTSAATVAPTPRGASAWDGTPI